MKQHLRPIMFVGTRSGTGKSVINAAFCHIFKRDGYQPAPLKTQSMSLSFYSTPEGDEMGRAQVVQAEACGIFPYTNMNPILLKPTNNKSSQVVLNGKPVGNMSAKDYFGIQNQKRKLFKEAIEAFKRPEARCNPIVLEETRSISELNLRGRDILNMRMTVTTGASTCLVVDIDRGGVLSSVYGTIALLRPEERVLMKGIIINKFHGDIPLFKEGRSLLKELTGIPVVGVIPWFRGIRIEEEGSVALDMKNNTYKGGKINVAIILLKRISNFVDFDVLEMSPHFNPYYTSNTDETEKADTILLPGPKNTLSDLQSLWASRIAMAIIQAHEAGKKVVGVCGGHQMMEIRLEGPESIERNIPAIPGLGLLLQCAVIEQERITRRGGFAFLPSSEDEDCKGYEVHMGQTTLLGDTPEQPVVRLEDGRTDGYYFSNRC